MTRAVFVRRAGEYAAFTVSGHSGYSQAGGDIVCSAVSAMTELVVNTVSERYGVAVDVKIDPKDAAVSAVIGHIPDDRIAFAVHGLIEGFRAQLMELERECPGNISVGDTDE